jgi:hypothetical protein
LINLLFKAIGNYFWVISLFLNGTESSSKQKHPWKSFKGSPCIVIIAGYGCRLSFAAATIN